MPEKARWDYLLNEVHHNVGDGLNKALSALEEANTALEGVVQHIDFTRKVGQSSISDKKLRDLIVHFSKYPLRNEDFEFPDLLGAAYEYLVGEFADSAGKKGGEFYTPRSVVRMMVRLIEPREGMRIYDPCSGSGGMLILSKEYVEEHGGNARNLALFGQENNGGVWSISKMNLLLHGIPDADIRNGDTLAEPLHTEGGELMRFDRVITNPPFSLNYTKDGIPFPERFRYGWCPEGGKKADLMFVQHMISVLRPQGTLATVMPHGVLFRGGAEREIRKGLLDDDLLDAVIGLAPNLFYGTGIPACILVLRAKGAKPPERRGKVLFINADAEFSAGRAQNYLLPEHVEKIVSAYHAFADIPGYATVVTHDELLANDVNLNIRRYADNAPPPEPHDVRAHLVGGIPKREVADKADLFAAHGFDPMHVFVERDADYYDFCRRRDVEGRSTDARRRRPRRSRPGGRTDHRVRRLVGGECEVHRRASRDEGAHGDARHAARQLRERAYAGWPARSIPGGGRHRELVGRHPVRPPCARSGRLRRRRRRLGDDDHHRPRRQEGQGQPARPPRSSEILLPEYLDDIEEAAARRAELEATIKGATSDRLTTRRTMKRTTRDVLSPAELATLKKELTAAKKRAKALEQEFVAKLTEREGRSLTSDDQDLVLRIARTDLTDHLDSYVARHRRLVIGALETWWDKYAVTTADRSSLSVSRRDEG